MPTEHPGIFNLARRLGYLAAVVAVLFAVKLWGQSTPTAPTRAILPTPILAQDASSAATHPAQLNTATGQLPTFSELYSTSPYINPIILALSVVSVALFLAFFMSVSTGHMIPTDFGDDVTRLVASKKYTEAAEYCRRHRKVFAASIIQRCVENADKDHATLLSIIDAEGRRRAELVWNRLSYLLDISNIAPMLGLLGTVLGLIQAFFVLPTQSTSLNSAALATAIGGAMSATFFGLIVAVACVTFHSILKSRATGALSEVERVVNNIADHMKRGGT